MRIVDIGSAPSGYDRQAQSTGSAGKLFQRRHGNRRGNAGGNGKTGRNQRIGDLEIAGKRNVNLENIVANMHFRDLLVTEMLDALQRQEIALAADGTYVLLGVARSRDRRLRPRIIGKDYRGEPFGSRSRNSRIFAAM